MAQLIVTVPKLNRRKRVPSEFPDPDSIVGTVNEKFTFEGVEEKDVPNPSLGKWYRDREGFLYWGGGLKTITDTQFRYSDALSFLDTKLIDTKGSGTQIFIIDTGITTDPACFDLNLIQETDLAGQVDPEKYHGTFIGGIVAGRLGAVEGIANKANITAIRYKHAQTPLQNSLENLKKALTIVSESVTKDILAVVNLSQGFNPFQQQQFPTLIKEIEDLIKTLPDNLLIFAAAGENNSLKDNALFPASMKETISVGCISEGFVNSSFSSSVDIITPFQELNSYDSNCKVVKDMGSSFSTAILCSMASLYMSKNGRRSTKADFIKELEKFETPKENFSYAPLSKFQYEIQ